MAPPLRMVTAAVAKKLMTGMAISSLSLCRTRHEAWSMAQLFARRLMVWTVLLELLVRNGPNGPPPSGGVAGGGLAAGASTGSTDGVDLPAAAQMRARRALDDLELA